MKRWRESWARRAFLGGCSGRDSRRLRGWRGRGQGWRRFSISSRGLRWQRKAEWLRGWRHPARGTWSSQHNMCVSISVTRFMKHLDSMIPPASSASRGLRCAMVAALAAWCSAKGCGFPFERRQKLREERPCLVEFMAERGRLRGEFEPAPRRPLAAWILSGERRVALTRTFCRSPNLWRSWCSNGWPARSFRGSRRPIMPGTIQLRRAGCLGRRSLPSRFPQ